MNSQEQIERFWKQTESLLKKIRSNYRAVLLEIVDEVNLFIKGYGLTSEKLRKPLSHEDKQTLSRYIERWKAEGVYTGYFKMYAENSRKRTYDDFLFIMMLYYFIMKKKRLVPLTMRLAENVAKDMKKQAETDTKAKLPDASKEAIDEAMRVDAYNATFDEYMDLKLTEDASRAMVSVRADMQTSDTLSKALFQAVVLGFANEFVNWRVNKQERVIMSGSIVQTIRSFANKIYVWFLKKYEEHKRKYGKNILFIAEMDDRTTPMCRSLNGQRFRLEGKNVFKRYSASAGKVVKVRCKGLVAGLNLPPITDHFHWCRSRVIYLLEKEDE